MGAGHTDQYLSKGYYCSLLAEARSHRVLPSVRTINDLREVDALSLVPLQSKINLPPANDTPTSLIELTLLMGQVQETQWQPLAKSVYNRFPAPVLLLSLSQAQEGWNLKLRRGSLQDLNEQQQSYLITHLQTLEQHHLHPTSRKKSARWDMAILVNEKESLPPSNTEAIKKFCKAASKFNIQTTLIQSSEEVNLSQFDALFIRETTAIDHPTYRLACQAEREGLIVMDDPASILRCCNKVFLQDAFRYQGVPSLKTWVLPMCDQKRWMKWKRI